MKLFNLTYEKVFTAEFGTSFAMGCIFAAFLSWLLSGCAAVAAVL